MTANTRLNATNNQNLRSRISPHWATGGDSWLCLLLLPQLEDNLSCFHRKSFLRLWAPFQNGFLLSLFFISYNTIDAVTKTKALFEDQVKKKKCRMWCWSKIRTQLWDGRASLVAQLVKNPLAMRETWVRSLGWEDPLEKGTATHSSILTGEFHGLYSPSDHKELDTTSDFHFHAVIHAFIPWINKTPPFSKIGKIYESEKIYSLIIILFQ